MNNRNDVAFKSAITDFQRRGEPNFAWQKVLSMYSLLPGLRGFWPMSNFDSSGNTYDLSGLGHTLTYNGNPTYNNDGLAPFIELDGIGDYLSRADEDDFDITGTEAMAGNNLKGLTVGGWFYIAMTASASLSASPSISVSPSASKSPSRSISASASISASPSVSPSPAQETLFTDFWEVTFTIESASLSQSRSRSVSSSISRSISPSRSASPSASISKSPSSSPSRSISASVSPSGSFSPTISPSPSASPSLPAPPSHDMSLITKWNSSGDQRSYALTYNSSYDRCRFTVTGDGLVTAMATVMGSLIIEAGRWYFIVGRYTPISMAVFVDNDKGITQENAVPASIFPGTASLNIGSHNEGTLNLLHGGASLCFVCATALPDGMIRGLYQHTRALFGL